MISTQTAGSNSWIASAN